jgi:hypothetical protein
MFLRMKDEGGLNVMVYVMAFNLVAVNGESLQEGVTPSPVTDVVLG